MAQKVNIVLVDDLDGSEGASTVSFGLDGATYEIELSEKNAKRLRESLAEYVGAARKSGGTRRPRRGASAGGPNPKDVREWARANGHNVPDRGRIPGPVREAYDAAH